MIKYLLISFLLISFSTAGTFAQKSFMKFGKVSSEELKMTEYLPDTSAGAVVLGDFGVTQFNYTDDKGFYLQFSRHKRIKILKKSELDQADFIIHLYQGKNGDNEDVGMIRGITFNSDGKEIEKVKLKNSAIFREEKDQDYKIVKFTMPSVKVGSVIDVTYVVTSPFIFTLNPWYFQDDIPVKKSEYHVYMPEYFNYKNWTSGYEAIAKKSEVRPQKYSYNKGAEITSEGRESGGIYTFTAQVTHWTYTATNVPAFLNEPYITTSLDYLSAVEFELVSTNFPWSIKKFYTKSWKNINDELIDDERFGKQFGRDGHLKEQVEQIAALTSEPKAQMQMAYEHIKKTISWDKRNRVMVSDNLRSAYNDGNGSSADINLNLVALLKNLGIKAEPVLLSTRSHGKLRPGQVILTQFNHVVVAVEIENETLILDATDHYCPAHILPPNSLNDKGLMISKLGYKWVDLYSNVPSINGLFLNVTINEDHEFTGSYQESQKNYTALSSRKLIADLTSPDEYKEEMEKSHAGLELSDLVIENLDDIYKPLQIKAEIVLPDRITDGGDLIYFNPILVNRIEENPFKNDERMFPIDFNYPKKFKYTSIINLPNGYTVEEIPESATINLPDNGGKFQYWIRTVGNQISVTYSYSINQTIFSSTAYPEIKKFYELMVSKQSEQIVLKRNLSML